MPKHDSMDKNVQLKCYYQVIAMQLVDKCAILHIIIGEGVMTMISNVSFRIDSDLKSQADTLFAQLGMNMTTAFNIFLRQSVREGRIPFEVTLNTPNAETVAALLESKRLMADPNTKGMDVEDALRELKA